MTRKSEPWYIHAVLWVVILILAYVLIRVAIINPQQVVEREQAYKKEARLRMENIRELEILWEEKHGYFTDDLDSLVRFGKTDTMVENIITGYDTLTGRSTNPFQKLQWGDVQIDSITQETFPWDSLYYTPKSHQRFVLQVDTTTTLDTVINRYGNITDIDTLVDRGNRYYLKDPDGYGEIGDLYNDALKNAATWE
jgi:hypothetical protein